MITSLELIISGQTVDLAPETDLTLEWVSGLFQDFAKVNLSRSYTVRLPKSRHNASILDYPGEIGHESALARTPFDAQVFWNGIDLIGEAQAYLVGVTDKAYEVAIIWNSAPALAALKDSGLKLTDIKTVAPLPYWKGANIADVNTPAIAFYAEYFSGIPTTGDYGVNAAPHPVIRIKPLLEVIFSEAGVDYTISEHLANELNNTFLLIAPSHRPNREQEIASGVSFSNISWYPVGQGQMWDFSEISSEGWDSPYGGRFVLRRGTSSKARIILNLRITSGGTPDMYLTVEHTNAPIILKPTSPEPGVYLIDETVDLKDIGVDDEMTAYAIYIHGLEPAADYTFAAWEGDDAPLFSVARAHDTINIKHDNRFPIVENLPDITQIDFFRACCALFGIAPMISKGVLHLRSYDEVLSIEDSEDWSSKLEVSKAQGLRSISYYLDGFGHQNLITFEEDDADIPFDPTIIITSSGASVKPEEKLFSLPFAASVGDTAQHYKVTGTYNNETQSWDYTAEDIDIAPRVFGVQDNGTGKARLYFPESLHGHNSVLAHYSAFQAAVSRPIVVEVNVRLSEVDLAALDLSRPVYFSQLGRYWAIISVQSSSSELCKVKLISLN